LFLPLQRQPLLYQLLRRQPHPHLHLHPQTLKLLILKL
jgi:hypothetical protein